MSNYRFTLEKYSGQNSRYTCPKCKMKKEFTLYIDTESNQYIAEHVGRCNRLDNCGYHFPPREYFKNNNVKYKAVPRRTIKQPKTPTYFFDKILVDGSLHCDDNVSNLFIFLASIFPKEKVFNTLNKYCVGVSKNLLGAIVFWQVDAKNRVRAGKVMQYNKITGRRGQKFINWIKKPSNSTSKIRQCFFGAHLLQENPNAKVAIVESEKTALICDLYFDKKEDEKLIWISSGGLQGLNEEGFKDLIGREVILFPDLSPVNTKNKAITIWGEKGKEIGEKLKIDIKLNTHLEKIATDEQRKQQEDIADFIIRLYNKQIS